MHVGVVLPSLGDSWLRVIDAARGAEELGADSVFVADHLLGLPPERGIMEAWTVMSAVAAATERVEIGAQVLCQSFRHPGLLARMAATLDIVSGGRLRMLIGAGWLQQEYDAYGFRFPSAAVRMEQLRDAVRILKGLMNADGPFSYQGKHYQVYEALNVPPPLRRPFQIEVGGAGDRMLRLIAREADGWNCPAMVLGGLDDRFSLLTNECEKAGRSIEDMRLSVQIVCAVGDDQAAKAPFLQMFEPQFGLVGSVPQAVERAGELMAKGIRDFNVILPSGEAGRACLERLLGEVRPQLR